MKLHQFSAEQWLPVTREALFPFFADAANLEALTPPWLKFQIITPPPIAMRAGAVIDYRLKLRGLPLRWRSEITAWVRFPAGTLSQGEGRSLQRNNQRGEALARPR